MLCKMEARRFEQSLDFSGQVKSDELWSALAGLVYVYTKDGALLH
jgi:hypothetical protein